MFWLPHDLSSTCFVNLFIYLGVVCWRYCTMSPWVHEWLSRRCFSIFFPRTAFADIEQIKVLRSKNCLCHGRYAYVKHIKGLFFETNSAKFPVVCLSRKKAQVQAHTLSSVWKMTMIHFKCQSSCLPQFLIMVFWWWKQTCAGHASFMIRAWSGTCVIRNTIETGTPAVGYKPSWSSTLLYIIVTINFHHHHHHHHYYPIFSSSPSSSPSS